MAKVSVGQQMVEATGTLQDSYHEVEVFVSPDSEGYSLWVNIDGICRLRATRIPGGKVKLDINGKINSVDSGGIALHNKGVVA